MVDEVDGGALPLAHILLARGAQVAVTLAVIVLTVLHTVLNVKVQGPNKELLQLRINFLNDWAKVITMR